MKTFFSTLWENLRSSYWFIPSLMSLSAGALSFLTVHLDTQINAKWARTAGWIWSGGPEGARSVLATISGSTITVAGVVFSITIVALTLASSQFGPRLLRNFMNDRWTQVVLGVFVATFLYSLLVLRTIRGTDTTSFRPVPFCHLRASLRGRECRFPYLFHSSRSHFHPRGKSHWPGRARTRNPDRVAVSRSAQRRTARAEKRGGATVAARLRGAGAAGAVGR